MRSKRMIIILIVIGLLAALTTTVYAANSYHPATPTLVGAWNVTVKIDGVPDTFETMHTYFADGNFVEATNIPTMQTSASHGVWIGSGNTYLLTFGAFIFDERPFAIHEKEQRLTPLPAVCRETVNQSQENLIAYFRIFADLPSITFVEGDVNWNVGGRIVKRDRGDSTISK